nr:hypothetical protein HMPREF0276_1797 [Corynebacterium accolens ATCC 49725]
MGLIPAHAGSTADLVLVLTARTAHPRSRGEHESGHSPRVRASGSSPLTRGAREDDSGRCTRRRLIPAHAGSTAVRCARLHGRRAHPRSRGEHFKGFLVLNGVFGSSPLTRGAHVVL